MTAPDGIPLFERSKPTSPVEVSEFLRKLGIGQRFLAASFANYQGAEKLIRQIRRAIGEVPLPNVFLFGVTGSGKSHLLVSILRDHIETGRTCGKRILYTTSTEFFYKLKQAIDFASEYERQIKTAIDCDLLILDDLGSEKVSEWSVEILSMIIDKRYCEVRPVIAASNLPPSEVQERYGARIASRLCTGYSFAIEMSDYRKKIAASWSITEPAGQHEIQTKRGEEAKVG